MTAHTMGHNINKFIAEINQNLICNICACVMHHSVVTLCGHSFCHSCLSTWLSKPETESCPVCRSYTSRYEIIPNVSLRNIVQSLPVWCDNKVNGCNIVVKLENLENHSAQCEYRLVECAACSEQIRQCDLTEHCLQCTAIGNELKGSESDVTRENITIDLLSRKLALLEMELNKTKKELSESKLNANELEIELSELREQTTTLSNSSTTTTSQQQQQQQIADFDPDYSYGYSPSSISQLSCLISKHLLSKPSFLDRNRIFMAIKRSFTYYHNYAGYSEDVHMLLATAYASNWFPEHHRWTLERWLEQVTHERFPRSNYQSNSSL